MSLFRRMGVFPFKPPLALQVCATTRISKMTVSGVCARACSLGGCLLLASLSLQLLWERGPVRQEKHSSSSVYSVPNKFLLWSHLSS